jgi:Ca-activated chloride channel family protein
MRALFDKLESPAVTNLSISFSIAQADITPELVPDLYRSEPLVLAAKVSALDGTMEIKGRIGDQPWTITLPIARAAEGQGLSKLWARRKIADAEVAKTLRKATPEETDKRILALGLEHQLVTRLTSLVAVDRTPDRPDGAKLVRADLPLNLPAGWDFDKVFGERPQLQQPRKDDRAQPNAPTEDRSDEKQRDALAAPASGTLKYNYGRAVPVAAAPMVVASRAPAAPGVMLPKTATDAELRMMVGFVLFFLGLVMLAALRWRAGLIWR